MGPDGSLYIGESYRVRQVTPDGIINTVAGTGGGGDSGDGGPATAAALSPSDVAVGPDGSLYLADWLTLSIRQVAPNGLITPVAGNGDFTSNGPCSDTDWITDGCLGDGGPATAAAIWAPYSVALGANGALYIADASSSRIRAAAPPFPGVGFAEALLPSEDGSQVYHFDGAGRHLDTRNALTGAVQFRFGYDAAGRLTAVTDGDENVTTIERDAGGNPTAIVGAYGQTTTITLDENGSMASITTPADETTRYSCQDDGLLSAMTTPRGHTYAFTYDELGRLIEDADPAGGSKTLTRTEVGASAYSVAMSTALGRTTTHEVETLSTGAARQTTTAPTGLQTIQDIGMDGQRTTTLPDGTTTTVVLRPDPRFGMEAPLAALVTTTLPSSLTATTLTARTATLSDPLNPLSLTAQTDSVTMNAREYTSVYDASTQTFVDTTPEGRQIVRTIDAQGRPLQTQVGTLNPVTRSYDAHGRLETITQGSGSDARVTTLAYNTDGFLASLTDALHRTTTFDAYDGVGRVTQETLPGNRVIAFDYDADGNLISLTPPGRPAHAFTYTAVDLLQEYVPPVVPLVPDPTPTPLVTTYTYNVDRQLELITRPDGATIDYVYDTTTGRLSEVQLPNSEALTYAYAEDTGHLESITRSDDTQLSFTYDGSLLLSETWGEASSGAAIVTGTVTHTYDNDFRVASVQVNSGTVIHQAYDGDGLLTCAGPTCSPTPGAGDLVLTRDPDTGLLTGTELSDGTHSVADAFTYNDFGELDTYEAVADSTTVYAASYPDRDKLGRVTEKTEAVEGGSPVTTFYTYDAAGRLYQVCSDASCDTIVSEYTYDDNGNRTGGFNPRQGAILSTSYDDQDRLLSYETVLGGAATYTYTANGELATKIDPSGTTTYTYDVLGNLRRVVLPDKQIDYVIDARNRRVGKKVDGTLVQGWLYDGQLRVVAKLNGSNQVVSRFVFGSKGNVPDYLIKYGTDAGTYRLITDHLGSPRLVVDVADGTVVQRLDYDEFGNVLADTNPGFQPFGFAGGLYDRDTKLVRFGVRDYDAETGRWTAKDPIRFQGGDTNLYGYVLSDPINFSDAPGLATAGLGFISATSVGGNTVTTVHQVVIDTSGHVGIASTVCYGGTTEPLGTTSAVIGSIGNAPTISDLSGQSLDVGVSVAPPFLGGVSGGASLTSGTSSAGGRTLTGNACLGGSVGFSPVDISGQGCKTTIIPLF